MNGMFVKLAGVPLTERELQVLRCMSIGMANKRIGGALHLSEETVKSHGRRLFAKLGVDDRVQAVMRGIERGLIPCPCGAVKP